MQDCLSANGVNNLRALEKKQDKNEYGYHSYMIVKDLEAGDSGAWVYLSKGKWARGSGADKMTFTLLKEVR